MLPFKGKPVHEATRHACRACKLKKRVAAYLLGRRKILELHHAHCNPNRSNFFYRIKIQLTIRQCAVDVRFPGSKYHRLPYPPIERPTGARSIELSTSMLNFIPSSPPFAHPSSVRAYRSIDFFVNVPRISQTRECRRVNHRVVQRFSCRKVPVRQTQLKGVAHAVFTSIDDDGKLKLERFANWLVANGVQGIGTPDSKAALYFENNQERGLAAVQPISKGEQIARVPLHLAITDEDELSGKNEDGERSTPSSSTWSIRLATKLVRMLQQGDDCAWKPYLDVLPPQVPTPLVNFEWDDVKSIAYSSGRSAYDKASWLLATSSSSVKGMDKELFEWAASVVHSRTFGLPSVTGGGVGIRMLVPLIDMLNHGGDRTQGPPGQQGIVATDNVRWDVVRKFNNESVMVLSATRDIAQGEELLLSYGERNNDDFFLHYGFIPPRNPHDDVTLFANVEHATAWLDSHFGRSSDVAMDVYDQSSMPELESESMSELERLKLLPGGQVDARLAEMCALNAKEKLVLPEEQELSSRWVSKVIRDVVGQRAKELLIEMHQATGMRLEQDLQWLAEQEKDVVGGSEHNFQGLLDYYGPKIAASSSVESVYSNGPSKGPNLDPNWLVISYRVYKAMILWDAVLLWETNL